MGIIRKKITILGPRGEKKVNALFDSGSDMTILREDVANEISNVFETGKILKIQEGSREIKEKLKELITPYIANIKGCAVPMPPLVRKNITEELIIGTDVMQNIRLKMDFEKDDVEVGECQVHFDE